MELPQLAVGSHARGSGRACVMNYLSYINGDVKITDLPSCTYPLLAMVAQRVNDSICVHRQSRSNLLCKECSVQMFEVGARLLGTNQAKTKELEVGLAVFCARELLALASKPSRPAGSALVTNAIDAAQAWLDTPNDDSVSKAWDAARDCVGLGYVSRMARHAALGAAAKNFLRDRTICENVTSGGLAKVDFLHRLIDEFEKLSGKQSNSKITEEIHNKVVCEMVGHNASSG